MFLYFMGLLTGIWLIYFIAYSISKTNYIASSIPFIIVTISAFTKNDLAFGLFVFIVNIIFCAVFTNLIKGNKQYRLNSGDTINKDKAEENQNIN